MHDGLLLVADSPHKVSVIRKLPTVRRAGPSFLLPPFIDTHVGWYEVVGWIRVAGIADQEKMSGSDSPASVRELDERSQVIDGQGIRAASERAENLRRGHHATSEIRVIKEGNGIGGKIVVAEHDEIDAMVGGERIEPQNAACRDNR